MIVKVGSIVIGDGVLLEDSTRFVEFEAEKVGAVGHLNPPGKKEYQIDEALYKTPDGRLIVHSKKMISGPTEATRYQLEEVELADLQRTGRFSFLGRDAGMAVVTEPLSLDEGLEYSADEEPSP